MCQNDLASAEQAIGYAFRDRKLLKKALTHSSRRTDLDYSNERLEFLGDAILGMIVSEYLFAQFPGSMEGDLTRIKSFVVSRQTLAKVSRGIGLEEHLDVGKGVSLARPTDGRHALPPSLLADVFEAVVAAIYLDGGLHQARRFVLEQLAQIIADADGANEHDHKSLLQQYAQRTMGAAPTYQVLREEGPEHGKSFQVLAVIRREEYCTGKGNSKKEAEQRAAEHTLQHLRKKHEGQE